MIGCEKLCGQCGMNRCVDFRVALDAVVLAEQDGDMRRVPYTFESFYDPARLAELLARALVWRGVQATAGVPFASHDEVRPSLLWVDAHGRHVRKTDRSTWFRAALRRVMALPLDCGADAALKALGQ